MSEIDYKVTRIHYPRTNNDNVLEFVFPRDPNLFLRKNKIEIRGNVEIPETYMPDNGFAAKLFSSLTVQVESQDVSVSR